MRVRAGRVLASAWWTALALACGAADGDAPVSPVEARPNIFLILIDTLRADRLGVYGNSQRLSPALDAIAREGVVFERAIAAAPWTQPSVASLFSSLYPTVHGVLSYQTAIDGYGRGPLAVRVLDDGVTTLAEALQAGGYETAAFVANPFVAGAFGFDQGFDHFDDSFAKIMIRGSRVNEAAISWLRERSARGPFFLYLHYMDVHGPYDAEPEYLDLLLDKVEALPSKELLSKEEIGRLGYLLRPPTNVDDPARHERLGRYREYWTARYDAGVRSVDHHIAKLEDALRELGLWRDAYVIATADHGEALLEHGLWDHGFSVHDYEVHVPLILRWPGAVPRNRRVAGTVQLIDLMPTLLEQLGLPHVGGVQGVSLRSAIAEGRTPAARAALVEAVKHGPEQKGVYLGNWKLMRSHGDGEPPVQQLFDVSEDPLEERDRAAEGGDELVALEAALNRLLAENEQLARKTPAPIQQLDSAARRHLEALGYTDSGPASEDR